MQIIAFSFFFFFLLTCHLLVRADFRTLASVLSEGDSYFLGGNSRVTETKNDQRWHRQFCDSEIRKGSAALDTGMTS